MPSTASASCHRISGRSGEPNFRQSVTPPGRAPAQETIRAASHTAMTAPRLDGNSRHDLTLAPDDQIIAGGDAADLDGVELPLGEDRLDLGLAAPGRNQQHPLLRLGQ